MPFVKHSRSIEDADGAARQCHRAAGMPGLPLRSLAALVAMLCVAAVAPASARVDEVTPASGDIAAQVAALKAQLNALEQRVPPPELGSQMIELQIRHDRLWWAGEAGNWNLAYYMVGELGEALRGIEQTNGEAAELQPLKLSDVMPSMMNPAIRNVQEALAKRDKASFAKAYDGLSAACSGCHKVAGAGFLHIQRPRTPLLDNLRYAPLSKDSK